MVQLARRINSLDMYPPPFLSFLCQLPRFIRKADASGNKIKLSEEEIDRRVLEMLEIVNLKGFEKRRTTQLSGGQQQRVAILSVVVLPHPLGPSSVRNSLS